MTREELRAASAARRTGAVPDVVTTRHSCTHCHREFQTEKGLTNHSCEVLTKIHEMRSPLGQAAFQFYNHWLAKRGLKGCTAETFMASAYYATFMKLGAYFRRHHISDGEFYIDLMMKKGLPPSMWRKDVEYSFYKATKLIQSLRPS